MAKATAVCTCEVCGETFEVIKDCYNRKTADEFEAWAAENITECDKCKRERMHAAADAQRASDRESGLPEILYGTEKQKDWAISIRREMKDKFDAADLKSEFGMSPQLEEYIRGMVAWLLREKVSARWWIDNRSAISHGVVYMVNWLGNYKNEYDAAFARAEKMEEINNPRSEAAAAAIAEAMIRPVNDTGKSVAEIKFDGERISAAYPRDEDFISAAKSAGLKWDSAKREWAMKIRPTLGRWQDRVAELGNALLCAGIPVVIWDAEARDKAADGTYAPRTERWIAKQDENMLRLEWERGNDDLYRTLKKLPGARYSAGAMMVPVLQWRALEDIAGVYDFCVAEDALALIEAQKAQEDAALRVSPKAAEKPKLKKGGLAEILKSSDAILPDLEDDAGAFDN